MTTKALTVSLVGLAAITWLYRPLRFIRNQTLAGSIYWTARSWLWNYPVTPDYSLWDEGDASKPEEWMKERIRTIRMWHFLRPFFAAQGYHLYTKKNPTPSCCHLIPPPRGGHLDGEPGYPYAHYACQNDEELTFLFISPLVWAARDSKGREVVIKAVSGATPTNELKAFHLLHSHALRNDPRNHTIPVLGNIEFNQQIFAVMPRWSCVFEGDFVTVGELIRYGRAFFEAVVFLHENKICHGDIINQNMMMDILTPMDVDYRFAGYHVPNRKYALIDFETAVLPDVDGSLSPMFESYAKRDIHFLADSLEYQLRCIEDVIPQIGDLFNSMKQQGSPSQPTAASAAARFEDICRHLTEEELNLRVQGITWNDGVIRYREGPPIYRKI